jgi:hypothetical protein
MLVFSVFVRSRFHARGWLFGLLLLPCRLDTSLSEALLVAFALQCTTMNSLYTMIPTTNVSISTLSKASLTFMVAALLLFHLAAHFYLRFLLVVTNDKPSSQQDRRLGDAMMLVARTVCQHIQHGHASPASI